jgi:hypothetical protein
MRRDSRGRFCKKDDSTPDLPLNGNGPKVGDIMYRCVFSNFDKSMPHHMMPATERVEEINQAGKPVCFPYEWRPEDELELLTFEEAKMQAKQENANMEICEADEIYQARALFNRQKKYDFENPIKEPPVFGIGDKVYVVDVLRLCGMHLFACKGVITSLIYYPEPVCGVTDRPGWKYEVYYKLPADEIDIEHGDKRGQIVSHTHYASAENIFKDRDAALNALRRYQHEYFDKCYQIRHTIDKLKPSDLKPPKD